MYRKANIFGAKSLEEMVKTIAGMPLLHQPGEFWEYSVSTDVLGRVVEVVSGMDLDSFVRERITTPLKMKDTGFWVKPEVAARLAKADGPPNPLFESATQKPNVFSGGGGMLSTAGDYARFSQMLLNGGELDGVRILSPKTIALMTSDQLAANVERHTPVALAIGILWSGSGNGHQLRPGLRGSCGSWPQSDARFSRRFLLGWNYGHVVLG
jgi:CubicO group peptidase (beta-lactamase class C family)